jgi:hypothetical protein
MLLETSLNRQPASNPSGAGVWSEIAVISQVPSWATGLYITGQGSNSSGGYTIGVRRIGQSWSPVSTMWGYSQRGFFVEIDPATRKIQQYITQTTFCNPYIFGYFGHEAGWLHPATQLTATLNQQWETYSFSPTNGDPCSAVLLEVVGSTAFAFRYKGTSIDISGTLEGGGDSFIVPVNASGEFELKMDSGVSAYIVGYLKTGVTAFTTAQELTVTPLNSSNTYTSPAIPLSARGRSGIALIKNIDGPATTNRSAILYHKDYTSFPWGGANLYEPGAIAPVFAGPKPSNGLYYSPYCNANLGIYYIAMLEDVAEPPPPKQYPAEDVTDGGWLPSENGADLAVMLADNDGDKYIYAREPTTCEVLLLPFVDPASSTGHTVQCRMWVDAGTRNVKVFLMQGATEKASWTQEVTTTATVYTFTLSGAQADSITDYAALRLKFELMA